MKLICRWFQLQFLIIRRCVSSIVRRHWWIMIVNTVHCQMTVVVLCTIAAVSRLRWQRLIHWQFCWSIHTNTFVWRRFHSHRLHRVVKRRRRSNFIQRRWCVVVVIVIVVAFASVAEIKHEHGDQNTRQTTATSAGYANDSVQPPFYNRWFIDNGVIRRCSGVYQLNNVCKIEKNQKKNFPPKNKMEFTLSIVDVIDVIITAEIDVAESPFCINVVALNLPSWCFLVFKKTLFNIKIKYKSITNTGHVKMASFLKDCKIVKHKQFLQNIQKNQK